MKNNPLNSLRWTTIKSNKSSFILSVFLLFLSITMFSAFTLTLSELSNNIEKADTQNNVEDFNFQSFAKLSNEQINKIEKDYNLKLEYKETKIFQRNNKNVKTFIEMKKPENIVVNDGSKIVNMYGSNSKYNLHLQQEPREINKLSKKLKNNEIGVSQTSYDFRGWNKNSKYNLNGKEYKIVPLNLVNYTFETNQGLMVDTKSFLPAFLNQSSFKEVSSKFTMNKYFGKFNKNLNFVKRSESYKKILKFVNNKNSIVPEFIDASNNKSINFAHIEVIGAQAMMGTMSLIIAIIAIIIVIFIIINLINKSRVELGVLKALGYKNNELRGVYLFYPIIVWILSVILAIPASLISKIYLRKMYTFFFSIPDNNANSNLLLIIFGLLFILTLLYVLSRIAITRVLNDSELNMINNKTKESKNTTTFVSSNNNSNFIKKLRNRLLKANKSLLIIFIIGFTIASNLVYIGLSFTTLFTADVKELNAQKGDTVVYKNPRKIEHKNGEMINIQGIINKHTSNNELKDVEEKTVSILGINKTNNPNMPLLDDNGKQINNTLDNKAVVISKKIAKLNNIKINDYLEVASINSNKVNKLKVTNISEDIRNSKIILNIDNGDKNFAKNNQMYTQAITSDYKKEDVSFIMTKKDIKSSIDALGFFSLVPAIFMSYFSIIIAIAIMWIVTKQLIGRNTNLIKVMILMGYKIKEIKTAVLNIYTPIAIILSIITYFGSLRALNLLTGFMSSVTGQVMEAHYSMKNHFIGFVMLMIIYTITLKISSRILKKIKIKDLDNLD